MYIGDFSSTATVSFEWGTYNSSGASVTRNVNGTISVFESTSTAAAVLGLTDNEDYRGVTGAHNVVIDLTATGFYVPGKTYSAILTNSSIDGQTVNAPLAQFSIRNRYMRGTDSAALAANVPANASATVISAGGVVDARIAATSQTFDQVGNVLGSVVSVSSAVGGKFLPANSSLLTISSSGVADARISATSQIYDQTGNLLGSVVSVSSNVVGSVGSVVGAVGSVTGAVGSVTGNVGGSVTSVSSNVAGNVTGSVGSIAGKVLPTNSSLMSISAAGNVSADVKLIAASSTAVDQVLTNLNATIASRSTLARADVMTTAMAESYAANGVQPTLEQAVYGIQQTLQNHIINSTLWTVRKLDGSTAFVMTLNSTDPTAVSR